MYSKLARPTDEFPILFRRMLLREYERKIRIVGDPNACIMVSVGLSILIVTATLVNIRIVIRCSLRIRFSRATAVERLVSHSRRSATHGFHLHTGLGKPRELSHKQIQHFVCRFGALHFTVRRRSTLRGNMESAKEMLSLIHISEPTRPERISDSVLC